MDLSTRVVLLMHAGEMNKTSNTGRIAPLTLTNSEIRFRGLRDGPPLSYEGLVDDDYETWLLYMTPEAEEVEIAAQKRTKPVRLLVPDGTWSQASSLGAKLAKRLPVKTVSIKAGEPSQYKLRNEYSEQGMATIEAIARVMGVLEGPIVRAEMERIFKIMVDRVLWTRGKISAEEVFGGLPEAAKKKSPF